MEKAQAFILITVKHGTLKDAALELIKLEEVQNVHMLFGQYDIIVNVKCNDPKTLRTLVDDKIGKINNVERTETLVVADMPV